MELDFQRVFEAAPGCCLLLSPAFEIVAVSDAYLKATMTERERIVGRQLFDVFPDNPDDPTATGVQNLRNSLLHVLETGTADEMAVQKYDIRRPQAVGGGFEERHWQPVNYPVAGANGKVAYVIHSVADVTDNVRLTQQGRQERVMRELSTRSEARYSQLLDTAPDAMVVVATDGRIKIVNLQTEKLFGYQRDELLDEHLELLIPERFRLGHRNHLNRFFASPDARPMGSGFELFGRRKDGTELPIEVSLSPLGSGRDMTVSAAIRDITERKRLEAAAKLNADRLASAVESMDDAFALFDNSYRLALCNSVYRRIVAETLTGPLVGRAYEEVLYGWMSQIAFSNEDERRAFLEESLVRSRQRMATFDVRMRDGRSLRVTNRQTAEGGLVKTIWDLTDDERRAAELRDARALAEAGSAAKSEFLSSMSHELRTPLNAILGFAQLLQRDKKEPLSARHSSRVNEILKGGEHLLRLIDDILDLSRIEAGGVSISIEPVAVIEVLEDVQRTLAPLAARQNAVLELELPASDVPMLAVDRTRFMQILINFGSNAIKYNLPEGRVNFSVSRPSPESIRITVKDSGIGIPVDKQHKLFQPFQRAGQETGPIEGTGIGLVISKRLAALMGGDVGFRSEAGRGSEFWVDVPAVHTSLPGAAAPQALSDARLDRLGNGGHSLVLYVEDNPANVAFMRDLLSTVDGIALLVAPTAETGVELARSRRPRAIIMDINLPGMSGLDALHALRGIEETKDIPVIALTAAASERDRQRGMQAGFYRYLTKPIRVDELLEALESLLVSGGSRL